MKQGFIKSFDGTDIFVYAWTDVESPKGIVQIFHGMSEHAKRYDAFAKFLNENGYLVFADDHRAHGKTAGSLSNLGKYNQKSNLFYDTLLDELHLSKLLTAEYNLPLYVFGHSYGSFLCQAYIEKSSYHQKAIMCGSALMKSRFDIKMGKLVAKLTAKFKGNDAEAKMVEKFSFGTYNKIVKTGSWLNTDEEEVKKYVADPYCGQPFSAKFYIDFFTTFEWIYNKEHTRKINKDKPLLLIAGKEDPVGGMGKSVVDLYKFYTGLEVKNLKMRLYKNARHEILHEPKIKQEVFNDILTFIENDKELFPVDSEQQFENEAE